MLQRFTLLHGDCIELMRSMPECSVDSVVTDPPYGIRFMGKAWDGADIERMAAERAANPSRMLGAGPNGGHHNPALAAGKYDLSLSGMTAFQLFSSEWSREALRVLKPGGYLLSFASPRTYHRMTCGIEDAGFEIRDQIMWIFGSGFPKSKNLGEGWGSALKPAHEPICVARKPFVGSLKANHVKHGTGGINIDECRVEALDSQLAEKYASVQNTGSRANSIYGADDRDRDRAGAAPHVNGRFPANLIHDGSAEVIALFPDSEGAGGSLPNVTITGYGDGIGVGKSSYFGGERVPFESGSGSAARFFYCAKASQHDRNESLESLESRLTDDGRKVPCDNAFLRGTTERKNHHPTVKPTDLMRYLCRLVTPRGGLILDPFMGSGSTGKAALLEGFQFIGCELDASYIDIARTRIEHASKQYAESRKQGALFEVGA